MINALSYVGFESPNADDWTTFGPDLLGLEVTQPGEDGAVRLRVDDAAWRIAVHPAEKNDLAYIGWDSGNAGNLEVGIARLREAGVEVQQGDADLARARDVDAVAWFVDPFGLRHELTCGKHEGDHPFSPGQPNLERRPPDGGNCGHVG